MEFEDRSNASAAALEAGTMLRDYSDSTPSDAVASHLVEAAEVAGVYSLQTAGLITIAALVMLHRRIPGAMAVLRELALPKEMDASVKA